MRDAPEPGVSVVIVASGGLSVAARAVRIAVADVVLSVSALVGVSAIVNGTL